MIANPHPRISFLPAFLPQTLITPACVLTFFCSSCAEVNGFCYPHFNSYLPPPFFSWLGIWLGLRARCGENGGYVQAFFLPFTWFYVEGVGALLPFAFLSAGVARRRCWPLNINDGARFLRDKRKETWWNFPYSLENDLELAGNSIPSIN